MRSTGELLPLESLESIKAYVDAKYNDLNTLINNILTSITNNQTLLQDLNTEIQNISSTIPQDLATTINNLGTESDFEFGIIDGLNDNLNTTNTFFTYKLGYLVGTYLRNKLGTSKVWRFYTSLTGSDTNSGLSVENPLRTVQQAISNSLNFLNTEIDITESGNEQFNNIFSIENKISETINCTDTLPYTLNFITVPNNVKSKLFIQNTNQIVFENIKFTTDEPVDTANSVAASNAIFIVENSVVKFKNCEFAYQGTNSTLWLAAKNATIILENCTFPDTNTATIFLTALDGYPTNLINIASNIGTTTTLYDNNSTVIVYGA